MLLITTALMIEARPLCKELGLQAVPDLPFPVFAGENSLLVVTGTGSQRAAAATGWALGRYPQTRNAVNIGFAAAAESIAPLHTWYRIHSIRDTASGRLHVPDILQAHPFPEAALLTVGRPARRDPGWEGLVDMEASGFYEAARSLLSPDRILVFKWVSDAFQEKLDPDRLLSPYTASLPPLLDCLRSLRTEVPPSQTEPQLLSVLRNRLHLSRTQDIQLSRWVRGYLSRGGAAAAVMDRLPATTPASKADNARILKELKDVLKG